MRNRSHPTFTRLYSTLSFKGKQFSERFASRHPEITISSSLDDRNPGCKAGFSIPVSKMKIRGSCETTREGKRCEPTLTTVSRRQAWSDIANPFANIDPPAYTKRNDDDAARKCTATTLRYTHLHLVTWENKLRWKRKKRNAVQASTLFFITKILYAIIDIGV